MASAPTVTAQRRPSPRRRVTRRGKVVVVTLGVLAAAAALVPFLGRPALSLDGLEDGQALGAADLPLALTVTSDQSLQTILASIDEVSIPVEVDDQGASITVSGLADGEHILRLELDPGGLRSRVNLERSFVVDTSPPLITLVAPLDPVPVLGPVDLSLSVDDPQASVTIAGSAVSVDGEGRFVLAFPNPPEAPIPVVATDSLGNSSSIEVPFLLDLPGNPGSEPIRGVHASGYTWTTAELKDPIMAMIESGQINTVEIDLKDEDGQIWWATSVPLATEIGAIEELWDLGEVVSELHAHGVRVIGRLVVFRDPVLADWAVETGRTDWIVQNPDGTPYGQYGGYTNPFSQEVWEYNIAIGEEAARLGVDDILYDYVRRPDAFMDQLRFPLQGDTTPEDTIVAFLEKSYPRIHAAGARLGASVFGIAATHPDQIAQPIPRMAATVDYVAPMVYPSHWGPNEYGVVDPNSSPYEIVNRSLAEFQRQVEGTDSTVLAWLQDFSLGVDYGPAEVRAQIDAAADAGVVDFLLWDAAATYTSAALDRS